MNMYSCCMFGLICDTSDIALIFPEWRGQLSRRLLLTYHLTLFTHFVISLRYIV